MHELQERRGHGGDELDKDAGAGLLQPEQHGTKFTDTGNVPHVVSEPETAGAAEASASDRAYGSSASGALDGPDLDVEHSKKKANAAEEGEKGSALEPAMGSPKTVAEAGTAGAGGKLPFGDQIQKSFGHHDVSHVRAHQGNEAATATKALGASAFAVGDAVAFGGAPDLHTAAHEAAHVVQQQGGVQLKGEMDSPGDAYEQHADKVADAVVSGHSAEGLLDQVNSGGERKPPTGKPPVQRKSAGEAQLLQSLHVLKVFADSLPCGESEVFKTEERRVKAAFPDGADQWIHDPMLNFLSACQGSASARGYFHGSMATLLEKGWIGPETFNEGIALAKPQTAVDKKAHAKQSVWMLVTSRSAINRTKIDRVLALLMDAGFSKAEVAAADHLLDAYQHVDHNFSGRAQVAESDKVVAGLNHCLSVVGAASAVLPAGKVQALRAKWTNERHYFQEAVVQQNQRTVSPEEREKRLANNGDADHRHQLEKIVEDLRYLDEKMKESNYGSLHPWTTLYGDMARSWGQVKLPKLEAILQRGQDWEIQQALAESHFHVNGIGGPRELADYNAEKNENTFWWMEKISDGVGAIPGIGIPAKLAFGGTIEIIKAAEGKQSLATALTKTATLGISAKLGPMINASGAGPAGKALLNALLAGVGNLAGNVAAVFSDPTTTWTNAGERINAAVARALIHTFVATLVGQAKVISGEEGAAAKVREFFIEAAMKFGIEPEMKEWIDRELPLDRGK